MLGSSKLVEQAGSFAGLAQVDGAKGTLLFHLLEPVVWFEDSLVLWHSGILLLRQTYFVRAFGVDQIVKHKQICISFGFDLN